ncbi:MAG: hypothetical protein KDA75_20455, partial [Planctomycetaceae bacterium]|nr:hypothetical protein [Planctomycetaceae bacterium]
RRKCGRCHKGEGSESGYAFNVADVQSLIEEGMLVEKDPANSSLYTAMFKAKMPPRNRPQLPRPSAEEIEQVKHWIEAGAPAIPRPEPREPVALAAELQAMHNDLSQANRDDRLGLRYFSLTHLYNDPTVDDAHLATARLALAKALNSLSWQPDLVHPRAINPEQTLYAVNLDDVGWSRETWNAIAQSYPYGVSFGALEDFGPHEIDQKIIDLRRDQTTPVVRGDWFVAIATKPPLYHTVLFDLHLESLRSRPVDAADVANPKSMTDRDLEAHLKVPVHENIRSGKAQRSGYTESGVSGQNRLIERHPLPGGRGFYWKSYDFKSSNRTAILSEFPLGPLFDGNEFNDLAFEHDGGEIIFTLPNGLQGYLLVDGKGNRIDAGPIEVVGDSLKTSGNEQIVTGLSCMACHRQGMIESPDDEVRRFSGAVGEAREHVQRLYPVNADFRKLLDRDRDLFLNALHDALDELPRPPASKGVELEELPEPVGEVARRYQLESMTLETVAAELWVPVEDLQAAVKSDPVLRQLGLRILLRDGGTIKRAAWESPAAFPLMKQTARQLGYNPR